MTDAGAAGRLRDSRLPADAAATAAGPAQRGAAMHWQAGKLPVAALGVDVRQLSWRRARASDPSAGAPAQAGAAQKDLLEPAPAPGAIEVAMVGADHETWVLVRVAGDPADRVLVYDQHEWACFLDGVRKGEFDDAD